MRSQPPASAGSVEPHPQIGVVGLWHLGCTIAASWLRLGRRVVGIDPDGSVAAAIARGQAPAGEPGVAEILGEGLRSGALRLSDHSRLLGECPVVFIAFDTTVRDDDSTDLSDIWASLATVASSAPPEATVIVSSQLPVGTARALRDRLQATQRSADLVYVPENLRLGEAIECYLRPGYIVIGSATPAGANSAATVFAPIEARKIHMSLESAELTKHAINSFLATSISLANHWSDVATATSADYAAVAEALRADARIGERAYVGAGLGFSGGTLGRDLAVLAEISRERLGGRAPLFETVLRYNNERAAGLVAELVDLFGGERARVAILGLTYKPGTSTLRRSRPMAIARALLSAGITVSAHDPVAAKSEVAESGVEVAADPYAAATGADVALLLTGWPEYRQLEFGRLGRAMRRRRLIDPAALLRERAAELAAEQFAIGWSMTVPQEWRG